MNRYSLGFGQYFISWPHAAYTFKATPFWAWVYHQAGRFMSDDQLYRLAQGTLR